MQLQSTVNPPLEARHGVEQLAPVGPQKKTEQPGVPSGPPASGPDMDPPSVHEDVVQPHTPLHMQRVSFPDAGSHDVMRQLIPGVLHDEPPGPQFPGGSIASTGGGSTVASWESGAAASGPPEPPVASRRASGPGASGSRTFVSGDGPPPSRPALPPLPPSLPPGASRPESGPPPSPPTRASRPRAQPVAIIVTTANANRTRPNDIDLPNDDDASIDIRQRTPLWPRCQSLRGDAAALRLTGNVDVPVRKTPPLFPAGRLWPGATLGRMSMRAARTVPGTLSPLGLVVLLGACSRSNPTGGAPADAAPGSEAAAVDTGAGGGGGSGGAAGRDGPAAPDAPSPPPALPADFAHPSAPPAAKDAFTGSASSTAAAKPRIVYPLDGSLLGHNIGGMNIQWSGGAGNTIHRVRLSGGAGQVHAYAGAAACPAGKCQLPIPDAFWTAVGAANAGGEMTLTVDSVPAAGGDISSDTVRLHWSPDVIRGGLYYWSSKDKGIMRVRLGDTTPEPYYTPAQADGECVGCHAVSRDGCRVAFTYNKGTGSLGIVDAVDSSRVYLPPNRENTSFQTWSPDGTRLMTLLRGELILRDAVGAEVARVPRNFVGPSGRNDAVHPEWSPDGQSLVFSRLAGTWIREVTHSGDIMIMPYANGSFGVATELVAHTDGKAYHYYPHYSPDSRWIVFNTGETPGASPFDVPNGQYSAYDQVSSRLRLVSAAGGTPIELAAATHGMDVTASWPKFSPFSMRGGNLFFVVFSSKIDYGWVLEQASVSPERRFGRPQLWVAAIDVARSGDPSYAPFRLPFQNVDAGNHLAYWTTKIVTGGTAGEMNDCPP